MSLKYFPILNLFFMLSLLIKLSISEILVKAENKTTLDEMIGDKDKRELRSGNPSRRFRRSYLWTAQR